MAKATTKRPLCMDDDGKHTLGGQPLHEPARLVGLGWTERGEWKNGALKQKRHRMTGCGPGAWWRMFATNVATVAINIPCETANFPATHLSQACIGVAVAHIVLSRWLRALSITQIVVPTAAHYSVSAGDGHLSLSAHSLLTSRSPTPRTPTWLSLYWGTHRTTRMGADFKNPGAQEPVRWVDAKGTERKRRKEMYVYICDWTEKNGHSHRTKI